MQYLFILCEFSIIDVHILFYIFGQFFRNIDFHQKLYASHFAKEEVYKLACRLPTGYPKRPSNTARPTIFAASCVSALTLHAKVNILLYVYLQLSLLNGMLLHTQS
jgi:hypothetical protein